MFYATINDITCNCNQINIKSIHSFDDGLNIAVFNRCPNMKITNLYNSKPNQG